MFGKQIRVLTMLAAALGIPYVWFNEHFSASVRNTWNAVKTRGSSWTAGNASDQGPSRGGFSSTGASSGSATAASSSSQLAPPLHQLTEVLRFDVTPSWVTQQWTRVSTVHAEGDLNGLRVPLVTGTQLHDIAGALTYYFDRQHRVRRITLHGQTGDESMLVDLATKYFGLHPEPALGAGMFVRRWNATPMNALRISHAPVVRADSPNTRLVVELELNDVTANYGLSADFVQLIEHDQQVRR